MDKNGYYTNELSIFDVSTEKFKELDVSGDKPCGRWLSTLTLVDDKIFLFGGRKRNYIKVIE